MSLFDYNLPARHTPPALHTPIDRGGDEASPGKVLSAFAVVALCCILGLASGCGFQVNHPIQSASLVPGSTDFGSVPTGTTSALHKLTLTNNYTQPISISSVSTTVPDFSSSSDCPAGANTLAPNATCTVTISFTPTATGTRTGTVSVSHSASTSPVTATLTGIGIPPNGPPAQTGVSLSPTSLSWTNIAVGQTSASQDVVLTNNGSSPLSISSISVGSDYAVTTTTCPISPSTLAAAASCTISVAFRPTGSGLRSSEITITDSDPSSPQLVALNGMAIASPLLFSPASLSFASTAVGTTSASQTATLTNQQTTPVAISGIAATAEFTQTNTCPATLAASASCTVSVAFAPAVPGARSGSVTVTYPSGSQSLALAGTATAAGGTVSVTPGAYAFPNQAIGTTSAPATITLNNGQSTALAVSSVQIGAPFAETNTCGASLAAGQSCTITVTYSPTVVGANSANLVITDNAANSPQQVAISGNASAAGPGLSTIPVIGGLYFYNQIVLTSSTPLPVTVINNQSTPVTISAIASTADYPFTTDCVGSTGSGTLAANASCTVQISFDPQAIGSRPSALIITHSASGSPISVPLAGTGIAGDRGLTVTVGPHDPCSLPSQSLQFTAFVTGTSNTAVNWEVNSVLGGNSNVGTITASGVYTAPAKPVAPPPAIPPSYQVKAVSQASPTVAGSTMITVSDAPLFTIYPFTSSLPLGGQQTFQPQVCNAPDQSSVTWSVDNIPNGDATVGTITNSGVYTAPSVLAPPSAVHHTVRVTDAALGKTSGAVVTVFSDIAVDFGSRTFTAYPVPANIFGAGRGESLQSVADRTLLTDAGVTVSRLYGQIPLVYATPTPDWTKIDPMIASIQAAGQTVLLQLALTPPWLQPNPNPCGSGDDTVIPSDLNQWAQIAASYVAHMDATFPGVVQDYEIWNEPNATGLCAPDHLKSYIDLYSAAAPLMKQQAATDKATIHVGGPVLSGYSALWLTTLLSNPGTAPYVDFVSYHQYFFGGSDLEVQWDTYNGDISLYQKTQAPGDGAFAIYNNVYSLVKAGLQPGGANTPIYITEFNTNFAFYKDCCRNDPTYAPVWNALYITDLLNSSYTTPAPLPVPGKMFYFAGSAYPWFCLIGVPDQNMDCLYSSKSVPQPYPQYYAFQLIAANQYLGLVNGGNMAKSINPPAGAGGPAVTAFYNATQDAVLITNPTSIAYSQIQVTLQNVGFQTPQAMLYQITNGTSINSSSLALTPQGTNYSATISVPAYSVQGIAVKGP